jgi:phosphoglycerate kinase
MIKHIKNAELSGKKVLVRVDFNVPIKEGKITDDSRIVAAMPTINRIIEQGGIPILMSHLGRPDGVVNPKYSLKPVAEYLKDNLHYKVNFSEDCVGETAKNTISNTKVGDVVLLENLRFYAQEEKNDLEFSKELASLADVYVNDAFGTAHRAHSSTYGVATLFTERYSGYLIFSEIEHLGACITNPIKPFTAIIGGAKISGKIDVIENLLQKCDNILIGGGMTFTFLKAMGYEIGNSLLEADKIELAKELIAKAKSMNVNLVLPTDVIVADEFNNDSQSQTVSVENIPVGKIGMDIGEDTIQNYKSIILSSKTVLWNGPMGVFEMPNFAKGTFSIAEALAETTSNGAKTIIGGGDSVAAIKSMNFEDKVTFVSTGGGASLEYLEGKELPGIKILEM